MKLLFTLIAVLLLSVVAVCANAFDEVHRPTEIDNLKLTIDRMGLLIKRVEPPRIDANTSHRPNSYCSWGDCVLGFNSNRRVDLVVCCASPVLRCVFKDRNQTTSLNTRNRLVAGGLLGKKYRYCHSGDYTSEDYGIGGVIGPMSTTNASGAGEMATYVELRSLVNDAQYLNRIEIAVSVVSNAVLRGDSLPDPPFSGDPKKRAKWCDRAMKDARRTSNEMIRLVLAEFQNDSLVDIQNKTDLEIQAAVELHVDELADAQFEG